MTKSAVFFGLVTFTEEILNEKLHFCTLSVFFFLFVHSRHGLSDESSNMKIVV